MYFEFRYNYFFCTNTYTASEFSLCLVTVVPYVITPSSFIFRMSVSLAFWLLDSSYALVH